MTPDAARTLVRTSSTVISALAVKKGEADAMLCGIEGRFSRHLRHVRDIIGLAPGVRELAALSLLITPKGNLFLCDTQVQTEPNAADLAEMTILAAAHVRRFGIEPKVALLSHSNFGSNDTVCARRVRAALDILKDRAPELEVDGEMQAELALLPTPASAFTPNLRTRASRAWPTCW